jgi:uroporphyrinogen-III synthase
MSESRSKVLIIRPEPELAQTVAAFRANGLDAIAWPALEIVAVTPSPVWSAGIHLMSESLKLIFASRNAVRESLVHLDDIQRDKVSCYAVGEGTASLLRELGFANVFTPPRDQRADSDSLLALDQFSNVHNAIIIVICGEGGRGLIADTLKNRGATLRQLICYRRQPATVAPVPVIDALKQQKILCNIAFSVEAWQAAKSVLPSALAGEFKALKTLVSHPRIASRLVQFGAQSVNDFDSSVEHAMKRVQSLLEDQA